MITIPEPCNEVWSEMKVVDSCHRHCTACDRVLTDFSVMSDDELMIFFKQSQGKICGRFRQDQLDRPLTPLPERTTKAIWWKAALLLPFTLFSRTGSAQQLPEEDSTRTETVVYPQLPDTVPTGVALSPGWNWADSLHPIAWPGDVIVTGGVPFMHEVFFEVPWLSVCDYKVNTVYAAPPQTESRAGIQAASSAEVINQPDAAHVAQSFGRAGRRKENQH